MNKEPFTPLKDTELGNTALKLSSDQPPFSPSPIPSTHLSLVTKGALCVIIVLLNIGQEIG
jgi:hypothetical protein